MSDNPHLSAGSTYADDAYDALLTDLRAFDRMGAPTLQAEGVQEAIVDGLDDLAPRGVGVRRRVAQAGQTLANGHDGVVAGSHSAVVRTTGGQTRERPAHMRIDVAIEGRFAHDRRRHIVYSHHE